MLSKYSSLPSFHFWTVMGFSAGTCGTPLRPNGSLILTTLRSTVSLVRGSITFSVASFQNAFRASQVVGFWPRATKVIGTSSLNAIFHVSFGRTHSWSSAVSDSRARTAALRAYPPNPARSSTPAQSQHLPFQHIDNTPHRGRGIESETGDRGEVQSISRQEDVDL